ncbi:MAG TPA: carboxypeptidase regulatory-like domain-containing protein [Gemmatimonadaceae bacterium]|nr:carboxypeptidase regulatory-like domain-containing protein [Gemmatimonadaceae bacterium]
MILSRVPVRIALALALSLLASMRLYAQVGSTTDILTGVVTGPDSKPLAGATVDAMAVDGQITRHAQTGANGRYTILFPDGGGQYRVTVRLIGMAPLAFVVNRQADEDRLVRDVSLSPTSAKLQEVTVTARRRTPRDGQTPGATGRNLSGDQAERLPIDASDLAGLAALAPGVVPIGATDSTSTAFSVAGQRPTANNITLDGLSFGGGSIPQDATRTTRIITNTYDVARGQFSGGQVATTTKGGTNSPAGSFSYSLRDRALEWGESSNGSFGGASTQNQLGGGFGGPIIKDKLFLFASAQGRWRSDDLASLLSANPATLSRLGVASDSVARFLALVNGQGVPALEGQVGDDRATSASSALARMDYIINDSHSLMIRADWRLNSQDPTRISAYSLPMGGGTMRDQGGGLMAALTSHFGSTVINEGRAYASIDDRSSSPFLALPAARVQISSNVADSALGITTLGFGGSPSLPQTANTKSLEISDELSWLPGDASHRIKLGGLLNASRFDQDVTNNREGVFTFNSLADLENDQPASFSRTLAPAERSGSAVNPALYLGDTWRKSSALQLSYGVRLEGSTYGGAPALNTTVDSAFGLRTNDFPSEIHLSPRVGFTWTLGQGGLGTPTTIIRGGAGEFRSLTPSALFSAAEGATGIEGSESQLVCIGSAVPTPDWSAYAADPSAIPTTCASATPLPPTTALPNVAAFNPNFEAPRAWRASLGVQRRVLDRFGVSLDASYARGVSLYGFQDVNLTTQPSFGLASEENRPVYVPASSIVPGTGAVDFAESRAVPSLGHVIEIGSNLQSDNKQVTLGVNGVTVSGFTFQASYTYMNSRDQSSFSCCSATQGLASATTAGDPNLLGWATSDFERKHSFLLTASYALSQSVELTTVTRFMSGTPYTPMVSGDINGDGFSNDRAFIFSQSAHDTAVANGMARLLAGSSSNVRSCLLGQMGTIANRNSCTGSWQPSSDLQMNFRPSWWGLDRRMTIMVSTVNMLAGLDELVHGDNDLHGWGGYTRPDPTLLFVRGFDPSTQSFTYAVNQRFGSTSGTANAFRVPFQLAVQARYVIGPDQNAERMRALFGAGGGRGRRGGGGGGGGGGEGAAANNEDLADRLQRVLPNPAAQLLELKDSLALTDSQVVKLTAVRDSAAAAYAVVADSIRAAVTKAGPNADPSRLFAAMRPQLTKGRAMSHDILVKAQAILTPEQWAKVPDRIKSPGAGRRGQGRGGP